MGPEGIAAKSEIFAASLIVMLIPVMAVMVVVVMMLVGAVYGSGGWQVVDEVRDEVGVVVGAAVDRVRKGRAMVPHDHREGRGKAATAKAEVE